MNSMEWYKNNYPDPNGLEELVLSKDGKVHIPLWLIVYVLKKSGVRSKKNRIVKKVIKREISKLISSNNK